MLHEDSRVAGEGITDVGQGRRSRVRSVTLFDRTDGVVMEEKEAAFDQLTSEMLSGHQNVLDNVKGLQEQRDTLNQEMRAKTAVPSASEFEKDSFEGAEIGPAARAGNGSCRLYLSGCRLECCSMLLQYKFSFW